jgi:hypothetical protein
MNTLVYSVDVPRDGHEDLTRVRVLYYEDGSMRFRVYETPLGIAEAYLQGGQNNHSIIKLIPMS